MLVFPICKINLGLSITRRREDGYHDLETVFYPIKGLKDALEIVPAKGAESTLTLTGKAVAGDREKNLVWKAYQLIQQRFPEKVTAVDIYLYKVIPMGAGLGGGSSDGAIALRLLNDFFDLQLNNEELTEMALALGSDCPFFIYNTPQFASGRGEQMTPIAIDLSDYSMQVVCPNVHVSTATAFSMIQPKPAAFDLRELPMLPINDWKEKVVNNFEAPVFEKHPELKHIKEQLYSGGAMYARMSGSGSALFGIFEKGKKADVDGDWEQYYFE